MHAVTVFQRYRFGNSPPRFQPGSLVHVYSGHQGIHLIRVLTAQGGRRISGGSLTLHSDPHVSSSSEEATGGPFTRCVHVFNSKTPFCLFLAGALSSTTGVSSGPSTSSTLGPCSQTISGEKVICKQAQLGLSENFARCVRVLGSRCHRCCTKIL